MDVDTLIRKIAGPIGAIGALLLFVALGVLLVESRFSSTVLWIAAAGVLMLVFFVSADPQRVLDSLGRRQARFGTNSAVMTVAFLGVLILLNFLSVKHSQLWDITASRRFTLSSQSIKVLDALKQPVTLTAFYASSGPGNSGKTDAQQLLDQYAQRSPKVTVKFVDPDQQPGIASQFNVRSYGTVVVQSGDKKQTVDFGTERDYTSAIIKVTSNVNAKIYFLTGHGERDLADSSDAGLQQFSDSLKKIGYDDASLDLTTGTAIPKDATGIVIAGPQKDLQPAEINALQQYLSKGGHVLALSEAYPKSNLSDLTKPWGMTFDSGIVLDLALNLQGRAAVPGMNRYPQSDLTKNLQGVATFYESSTAVVVDKTPPTGVQVTPILQTSAQSYESKNPDKSNLNFNQATDVRGPITLGAIATKPTASATAAAGASPTATPTPAPALGDTLSQQSRLAAIGDVTWLTNKYYQVAQIGNQDLALAAGNWIGEQDSLVNLPPPPTQDRSLFLTGGQGNLLLFTNFLFVPAIVFAAGVYMWYRRR